MLKITGSTEKLMENIYIHNNWFLIHEKYSNRIYTKISTTVIFIQEIYCFIIELLQKCNATYKN